MIDALFLAALQKTVTPRVQVGRLETVLEWTILEQDLAVATNEHLERMLLELDNVTGLQGDNRTSKKAAVALVNSLCSRLDALRLKHSPVGTAC